MSSETAVKKNIQKLQRAIVDGLEDVKAQDIQVFNTEALSPLFERVIIASGTSNRQTKALAASVRDAVRDAGFDKPRTEGEENGEWIIVDCGAAVVHVMQPSIRQYYRLEEIWGAKAVRLKHAPQAKFAQAESEAARQPAAKRSRRKPAPEVPAQPAKPARQPVGTARAAKAGSAGAGGAGKTARKTAAPATATAKPARKAAAPGAAAKTPRATRKPAAPMQVVKVGAETRKPAKKSATQAGSAPARTAAPRKAPARKAAQPKA